MNRLPYLLLVLVLSAQSVAFAGNADPFYARYISSAIQGDLSAARDLFEDDRWKNEPGVLALKEQFEERFQPQHAPATSDFAHAVVLAYRAYWRDNLLNVGAAQTHERILEQRIDELLEREGVRPLGEEDRFSQLRQSLNDRGLHVLESAAPPMRDLFVWRDESPRQFRVHLHDTPVDLEVVFIDDFAVQGWKDFASLGLATTTGWVEDGILYCLAWAYDTESENFEVSYLKHEARHLVDLERYPQMGSEELEYRAKLTELAHANHSLFRVLKDFTAKAAQNPDSAHAMANWRVIRDLYWELNQNEMPEPFAGWDPIDADLVNQAARRLLSISTERNAN